MGNASYTWIKLIKEWAICNYEQYQVVYADWKMSGIFVI